MMTPAMTFMAIILCLIELLLLLRREHGTNLGDRVLHHLSHFFHGFAVNGFDLWAGLIDDRLDPRLLIRSQTELVGKALERWMMPAAVAVPVIAIGRRGIVCQHPTAESEKTEHWKGNEFQFHK